MLRGSVVSTGTKGGWGGVLQEAADCFSSDSFYSNPKEETEEEEEVILAESVFLE